MMINTSNSVLYFVQNKAGASIHVNHGATVLCAFRLNLVSLGGFLKEIFSAFKQNILRCDRILPYGKIWSYKMTLTMIAAHATTDAHVGASEFLAFQLGEEEYGIDIQKVQEIRAYEPVTRMANALPYVKGVVNLRGIIVPIIDMRIKLELGEPTYDHLTVVIILNIAGRTIGMVVDRVSDVITLTADQIKPAPDMGSAVSTDYLVGLGTIEDRMLVLVDIDRLMTSDDMGLVAKLAA